MNSIVSVTAASRRNSDHYIIFINTSSHDFSCESVTEQDVQLMKRMYSVLCATL